jgi:hypothetical protein
MESLSPGLQVHLFNYKCRSVDNNKNFTCIVCNAVIRYQHSRHINVHNKPVYQVSFEAGDGVAAPASQQTAEGGKLTQPAAPSRNGYVLVDGIKMLQQLMPGIS